MYYTLLDTILGQIAVAGDFSGLRHIEFQHGQRKLKLGKNWKKNNDFLKPATEQLIAYFAGELKAFDLLLAPKGTPFQEKVWKALLEIPYGSVATYKEIAKKIKNPKAVRAVGGANGKNPLPIVIPCHRVIGADGSLTGFSSGLNIKKQLLLIEGININS